LVRSELHRQLKITAFNNDVKLQDLVDAILENALNDKVGIMKKVNADSS